MPSPAGGCTPRPGRIPGGWSSKADASGSHVFYGAGAAGQPPGVELRRCRQQRRVPPGNYGIQASPWSLEAGGSLSTVSPPMEEPPVEQRAFEKTTASEMIAAADHAPSP